MTKKTTILLAEDEPALGQIIKESLETQKSFNVLLCDNGEKAMQVYQNEAPELLVLDVMMPKKDGFTLAKEIRAIDDHNSYYFFNCKITNSRCSGRFYHWWQRLFEETFQYGRIDSEN